jgi:hypothetical protein
MAIIKKFDSFLSENLVASKPDTITKPTPTITPTTPKPSRPGITPTEVPSEEDSPLASAQKVIDRFESVYNNASEEDKKEIDSYFEK